MAFEELKGNTSAIQENAKAYVETTLAYYKLKGFKIAMKSATMMVKVLVITVFLLIFLLFVSIAGALALGEHFGSYPIGFLIVAGIYFVLVIVLILIKDKLVEGPVLEKFSEIFFNE